MSDKSYFEAMDALNKAVRNCYWTFMRETGLEKLCLKVLDGLTVGIQWVTKVLNSG